MEVLIITIILGAVVYLLREKPEKPAEDLFSAGEVCPVCSHPIDRSRIDSHCPHCDALISGRSAFRKIEEITFVEKKLLSWYEKKKITHQRFNSLMAYCEGERKWILDGIEKELAVPADTHERTVEAELAELGFIGEQLASYREAGRIDNRRYNGLTALFAAEQEELLRRSHEQETKCSAPAPAEMQPSGQPETIPGPSMNLPSEAAAGDAVSESWEVPKPPEQNETVHEQAAPEPERPRYEEPPIPAVTAASSEAEPPAPSSAREKLPSNFLSENSIKLMLYVGTALFMLGASIFVKNYWDVIPGVLKFASLFFVTVASYLSGYLLHKINKIPRTSVALMVLGSLLVPYNFFAVNNFALLGGTYDWDLIWLLTCIVCLPLYVFNARYLASRAFFYCSAAVYTSIIYLSLHMLGVSPRLYPVVFSICCSLLPLGIVLMSRVETVRTDIWIYTHIVSAAVFACLVPLAAGPSLAGAVPGSMVSLGYLLLCLYYAISGVFARQTVSLYPAIISFNLSLIVFMLRFHPSLLTAIAVVNTSSLAIELALRKITSGDAKREQTQPVHAVHYAVFMVTAAFIFTMEIAQFIVLYFTTYDFEKFLVYRDYSVVWISLIGIVYLAMRLRQWRRVGYQFMIAGYLYIVVFTLMQFVIPASCHAFGFMFVGIVILLIDTWYKTGEDGGNRPLRDFSYAFTICMTGYLFVKYVTLGVIDLTIWRIAGLLIYYGLALYLNRDRTIFYLLSAVYYWAVFVVFAQIAGMPHYALIAAVATLPFTGLHLVLRNKDYAAHLLVVQTVMLTLSFILPLVNHFYLAVPGGAVGAEYYSGLAALSVILAVSVVYGIVLASPTAVMLGSCVFYLIVFVTAYPLGAIEQTGAIVAGSGFVALLVSRIIRKYRAPLSTVIDGVTHAAQALVFAFALVRTLQAPFAADYTFVIAALALQSIFYTLYALANGSVYNYIGGTLGYLCILLAGGRMQADLPVYCCLFTVLAFLQGGCARFLKKEVRDSFLHLSLGGATTGAVMAGYALLFGSGQDLAVFVPIAAILVIYFSLVTFYVKDPLFVCPAALMYFLFMFGIGQCVSQDIVFHFLVLTLASFVALALSRLFRKKRPAIGIAIDGVTHAVQVIILAFTLVRTVQTPFAPGFGVVIASLALQSIYYTLYAYLETGAFNYVGGILGYLCILLTGYHLQADLSVFCYLFTALAVLQGICALALKKEVKDSFLHLSLIGATVATVLTISGILPVEGRDLAVLVPVAAILVVYYSALTFYVREPLFAYPATFLYFILVYGAGQYAGLGIVSHFLVLTLAGFVALAAAYVLKKHRQELFIPVFAVTHGIMPLITLMMMLTVYYFRMIPQGTILWTVLLQVVFYAANAYLEKRNYYIYPSGLLLNLLVWIIFPSVTHLGIVLLPVAGVYSLVTFLLKKRGAGSSGAFHMLGQIVIGIVLFTLVCNAKYFLGDGFGLFLPVLFGVALLVLLSGLIYRSAAYTYGSAAFLIVLLVASGMHWHFAVHQYNLMLVMFAAAAFAAAKAVEHRFGGESDHVIRPFVSVASCILAATFVVSVARFFACDIMQNRPLSPGEINVAALITFIVTAVYGTLSYLNRDHRYVYCSLGSFFILYLLVLTKLGIPLGPVSLICFAFPLCLGDMVLEGRSLRKFSQAFYLFLNGVIAASVLWSVSTYGAGPSSAAWTCGIGSLIYLAAVIYRPAVFHSYLFQFLGGGSIIIWVSTKTSVIEYAPLLCMGLSVIYAIWGYALNALNAQIEKKPYRDTTVICMSVSLVSAAWHPDYAYLVYGIYAVLLFAAGTLRGSRHLKQGAYVLLLVAYEFLVYHLGVKTIEYYTIPLGAALFVWGMYLPPENEKRETLFNLAMGIIYTPGLIVSVHDTWGSHGILLGILALALFLTGIRQRSKSVIIVSSLVLVLNGVIQSYSYIKTIPRWVYMASGGTLLITLGMIFELKREKLQQVSKELVEKWRCFK